MSDRNEHASFDDLADGSIPSETLNDAQEVLSWKKFDTQAMMLLRIVSLCLALFLSGWFLCKGLVYTEAAIYSVVDRAAEQKEPSPNNVAVNKSEGSGQATAKLQEKTDNKPQQEEWDKTLISSGSIITLIAFVLGVGLTLILAVIKLSITAGRTNEQPTDYVGLTGPFGELLTQFANWVKSKGK